MRQFHFSFHFAQSHTFTAITNSNDTQWAGEEDYKVPTTAHELRTKIKSRHIHFTLGNPKSHFSKVLLQIINVISEEKNSNFSKVKWLHLTGDKSVRFSCQIFSGFNIPKITNIGSSKNKKGGRLLEHCAKPEKLRRRSERSVKVGQRLSLGLWRHAGQKQGWQKTRFLKKNI